MTPPGCGPVSDTWVVTAVLLEAAAPLALGGIALINAGLARSRSVAHVLFSSLLCAIMGALSYVSIGFIWQSAPCLGSHSIAVGKQSFNVIGLGPFLLHGIGANSPAIILLVVLGVLSAAFSALIPVGAASERWTLGPALLATAIQTAIIFPIYAHWSWPGGWLHSFGLMDAAGSGFIHAIGGLWALIVIWFAGPRKGKYSAAGMPAATPGHNAAFILAGCFLVWAGWGALNGTGALILGAAPVTQVPYVLLNTLFSGVGGLISSAFITRVRFTKTDASLCANGWIGGLVAGSAGCTVLRVPEEMLAGLIAGTLVIFAVELFEMRLKVDDPAGAISVHGVCGLWGLMAAGLFRGASQSIAQLTGIAMILGIVFPAIYAVNALVNRFYPYRMPREAERQGMDLYELGAGAYPEFMLHRDDFNLR